MKDNKFFQEWKKGYKPLLTASKILGITIISLERTSICIKKTLVIHHILIVTITLINLLVIITNQQFITYTFRKATIYSFFDIMHLFLGATSIFISCIFSKKLKTIFIKTYQVDELLTSLGISIPFSYMHKISKYIMYSYIISFATQTIWFIWFLQVTENNNFKTHNMCFTWLFNAYAVVTLMQFIILVGFLGIKFKKINEKIEEIVGKHVMGLNTVDNYITNVFTKKIYMKNFVKHIIQAHEDLIEICEMLNTRFAFLNLINLTIMLISSIKNIYSSIFLIMAPKHVADYAYILICLYWVLKRLLEIVFISHICNFTTTQVSGNKDKTIEE